MTKDTISTSSTKRLAYAKFKIDPVTKKASNFVVSGDLAEVQDWDLEKNPTASADDEETASPTKSGFARISQEFERTIGTFQTAVPFVMSALPILAEFEADRTVREYIAAHGTNMQSGEVEIYSFPMECMQEVVSRLSRVSAIHSAIGSAPGMYLTGLVSAYDAFLSKLIREVFLAKPEMLSSSERNISFKDLVEIGSVESARERILEKEIESVMRSSHSDQVQWLETKLGMTLRKDLKIWPDFIELCERRNLLTHADGVISSQYLKVCKDHGYNTEELRVGQKLNIPRNYYAKSVEIIFEFGMKLIQVVWRKILPDEIGDASIELNQVGYRLLERRNYELAAIMLGFGHSVLKKHGSEYNRKMIAINYANAEKLSGRVKEGVKILETEDWSAASDNFQICVLAVKDDVDQVSSMMKAVVDAKLMPISAFREWPVFTSMRSNPMFVQTFEQAFGEKLFLEKKAAATAGTIEPSDRAENDTVDISENEAQRLLH